MGSLLSPIGPKKNAEAKTAKDRQANPRVSLRWDVKQLYSSGPYLLGEPADWTAKEE